MTQQYQRCLLWNSFILADYLCFVLLAPVSITIFLVLSKWIIIDGLFSVPLLILFGITGCMIMVCLRMLPQFHTKYMLLEEGIHVKKPFSKPSIYRWEDFHQINIANMRVNKSDFPIIRLFLQPPDTKLDKADRSIDRYLWMSKSVLILSFTEERIGAIRQFSNQAK